MKKILLYIFLFYLPAFTYADCFLVKENDRVIKQEGDCNSRHSPCSTFKIALSLIGYDSGILLDETHPEVPFKEGYADSIENWRQAHNPILWMKNSCVWYSQILTQKLGIDKFQEYIKKLNYGNQDISGDIGKDNGLTQAWLSSSLEISPHEQIAFLQSLIDDALPVSLSAHEMTKKLLFIEKLGKGWKLYGKTGAGSILNADRVKTDLQIGWFIGWMQKYDRTITFVQFIEDTEKHDTYASVRARAAAKEKLKKLFLESN